MVLILQILPVVASVKKSAQWQIQSAQFSDTTAGYVSEVSVDPGKLIKVFITCDTSKFTFSVFRMGFYGGDGAEQRWKSKERDCIRQTSQRKIANTNIYKMNWVQTNTVDTTGFKPGFYLIRINASDGTAAFINFVIRNKSTSGKVVMVMPLLTSAAYNGWTGTSTYSGEKDFDKRNRHATFDSPNDWGFGSGLYLKYVHPLLIEADKTNAPLAFLSDIDVASNPKILDGAMAYVSAGHDEYWTQEQRDSVLQAREKGMNLLFMGANVAYWRVRLLSNGDNNSPTVIIYKSLNEDPNKKFPTIRFRDAGESESELTGLEYSCYPASGSITFQEKGSFIFKDVTFPKAQILNQIVGPETDVYIGASKFEGQVQILATSRVNCDKFPWVFSKSSHMIYGVSKSGAGTFSTGTMGWVLRGLSVGADPQIKTFVAQVTRNVIEAASKGPLGKNYPIGKK